jgi:Mn-dependent DtxR family transcriptional regulator
VALWVGVSHTTGTFKQYLRNLVGDGYLIRESGHVSLTAQGRAAADPVTVPSRSEILNFWIGKLSGPQGDMLRQIVDVGEISREELAERLGKSHTTGTYKQDLRNMRTYGLIDFKRGQVVLTDLLSQKESADGVDC